MGAPMGAVTRPFSASDAALKDQTREGVRTGRERICNCGRLARASSLSEAASCGAPKCSHEIVQFLQGERLFQDRRCGDEGDVLIGVLLAEVVDKFGAAGARTAQEFQSHEDNVVGSLVAVNAERFTAVWREPNFVTELVEHDAG